jgi:ribosomal protein S12 methylthiotransferase accessory factor
MTNRMYPGSIHGLLQPLGGLFTRMHHIRTPSDEPRFAARWIHLGNLAQLWPEAARNKISKEANVEGSGLGLDEEECTIPAFAEALERYCACAYVSAQFIVAAADELGRDALDLDTIPCCSRAELSHPRCSLVLPDKKSPIRWVRGLSLLDGRIVYVPAVMVYMYTGLLTSQERFWCPITTGCAAHESFERALLPAILEVIERDALSITWLQKLALPRINVDRFPPLLAEYWDRYLRSSAHLAYVFFDATTDLGVPTVYGIQICKTNPRLTTLVACSANMQPYEGVVKVMRELAQARNACRNARPVPENWDDFTELFHGPTFMARAEQARAFDFLLRSPRERPLSDMLPLPYADEKMALRALLEIFRSRGMDVYAIDLSTDEALRCGIRVVRAVIPGLQPFSFKYRAQYLGHSRLYEAPKRMGYPVFREDQLNRWPQPFF